MLLMSNCFAYGRHYFQDNTVNSEIFARTLFSRNFAYAKFRENKTLAECQNHSFIDIGKSCLSRTFFTSLICH